MHIEIKLISFTNIKIDNHLRNQLTGPNTEFGIYYTFHDRFKMITPSAVIDEYFVTEDFHMFIYIRFIESFG